MPLSLWLGGSCLIGRQRATRSSPRPLRGIHGLVWPSQKGSTMNWNTDIRNSILAELSDAEDRLRVIEDKLFQDPNNWELQGEFDEQQQVCLALEGDLENYA